MEQANFLVITTISDKSLIDRICTTLEDAEIPLMLEHVEIIGGKNSANGVRVLVPEDCTRMAMRLLETIDTDPVEFVTESDLESEDSERVLN